MRPSFRVAVVARRVSLSFSHDPHPYIRVARTHVQVVCEYLTASCKDSHIALSCVLENIIVLGRVYFSYGILSSSLVTIAKAKVCVQFGWYEQTNRFPHPGRMRLLLNISLNHTMLTLSGVSGGVSWGVVGGAKGWDGEGEWFLSASIIGKLIFS